MLFAVERGYIITIIHSMLHRFSIPIYSLTSNSISEYSCLFHHNSCSIFTIHRTQFHGWLPVCPSVLAFLLHDHRNATFEFQVACYINTTLLYKTGWEWGGGGLAFLWIHVNSEVLQAVSLMELSAVLRGVHFGMTCCHSHLYFSRFSQVPLRRSYLTCQTIGCH